MDDVTRRWIKTPGDEKAAARGCWFSEKKAQHVVDFFEKHLRHTIGRWAGQPLLLMDWQKDEVLRPLFGWQGPDGTRRFRQAYIEIPKKNGKSTMCSGLALYLLAADGEPGAQVFCAASDRDQAGIVYREASAMAKASPLLRDYILPRDSVKNLALPSANAFLRAISREAFSAEGLNIHGLIFDELHAQRTRDLWDALRYGGAARRQPLLISITTAGFDRHSICYEIHERAQKILDGAIEDDTFFAYIRSAGLEDDWKDPATWTKANPSLGVTISMADMEQACREAVDSPSSENVFKRYRLNIWTESETRWIPWDKWVASAGTVDEEELLGQPCYAGLDLATVEDLTALVLVFPRPGGVYKVLPFFFAPKEGAIKRERDHRVPYMTWARQGFMELTEGDVTDYAFVLARIRELALKYQIKELAFDPWNAQHTINELAAGGGPPSIKFPQTIANFNEPMKTMERLILKGDLHHGRNPIMDWMITNVAYHQDASGNIRPDKEKSRDKIDGVVATIMALARAGATVQKQSVYATRGLIRL